MIRELLGQAMAMAMVHWHAGMGGAGSGAYILLVHLSAVVHPLPQTWKPN